MKRRTTNVYLGEKLLKEIDREAEEEARSVSEIIREAVRFYLRIKSDGLEQQVRRIADALEVIAKTKGGE